MTARSTRRRQRGAVIPMVALTLTTLLTFAALAVDLGLIESRIRDLQQVADLAALDASRLIDGRTETELRTEVTIAALASAARNDFVPGGDATLDVELGVWEPSGTSGTFTPTADTEVPNAVQVIATDGIDRPFLPGTTTKTRNAIATVGPTVDATLGSVLAGANPTILNEIGESALGASDGSIDVVSYEGLASASVHLGDLAAQLGFGSVEELLAAQVGVKDLYEATVVLLNAQGDQASVEAAIVMQEIADATPGDDTIGPIGASCGEPTPCGPNDPANGVFIFDNSPGSVADGRINIADLLIGSYAAIDGDNLLSFELDPVALGFDPGTAITRISARVSLIEAAQTMLGMRVGQSFRTSQARTAVTVEFPLDLPLQVLDPVTGLLGETIIVPVDVRLPFVFDLAQAIAELTRAQCFEPETTSETDFLVQTSAFNVFIGDIADADLTAAADPDDQIPIEDVVPADVFDLSVIGLGPVHGNAELTVGGSTQTLSYVGPYPSTQRAFGGVDLSGYSDSLFQTLMAHLNSTLGLLGVQVPPPPDPGILPPPASDLAKTIVALVPDLFSLDDLLFEQLIATLGVTLGGADLTVEAIECEQPNLVE